MRFQILLNVLPLFVEDKSDRRVGLNGFLAHPWVDIADFEKVSNGQLNSEKVKEQ